MIEDLGAQSQDVDIEAELAIIGAGPAGIVTALEVAARGVSVVLVESGGQGFDEAVQRLSEPAEWDRHRHAPMSLSVRRQVGGTSNTWGGRCVPFDPVDFEPRPYLGVPSWPLGYEDLRGYFQRACDWMVCGRVGFSLSELTHLPSGIVPGFVDDGIVGSTLERWSLPTNFGHVYGKDLERSPRVRLLTGVTCTEIVCPREGGRAQRLECRTLADGHVRVTAKAFVVACGGLESTRLLMCSTGPHGEQLGNLGGHLGCCYMAHVEGAISNIRFTTPPRQTVFGYERDTDGVYVRRRFSFAADYQREHDLPNIVGWLGNWPLSDARHGYGQLSFVYLALTSKLGPRLAPEVQRLAVTRGGEIPGTPYGMAHVSPKAAHLRNILRHPVATSTFAATFGTEHFLARGHRVPGFFMYSKDNLYPFQYHGEHLPNPASKVTLTEKRDRLGRRKLAIDLRFTKRDIDGTIRAHEHWDQYFRKLGIGQLEYQHEDLEQAVDQQLGGGFHQAGTTQMSASPADGVVDENLAVHGAQNVYVASSSSFVTSGQANPTFMIVAFAVRLADHLVRQFRPATIGRPGQAKGAAARASRTAFPGRQPGAGR